MMFIYAAVVALWFQTTETPNPNIWIDNNEVWMQTAGGPRQLTSDNIPKRLPLLSPDGKRLIYVVDQPSPDVRREPEFSHRVDQEMRQPSPNRARRLRTVIDIFRLDGGCGHGVG